ncbi:MAG: LexA family protein [Candidatus Egerieousia sp.]
MKKSTKEQERTILQIFSPKYSNNPLYNNIPLATESVHAGFPSPAEDMLEESLDINKLLVKHPAATYYVRVKGESMRDAGIYDSDILVVDKSLEPTNNCIAVCYIDGEFTLKRVLINAEERTVVLMPANSIYKPIIVTPDNDFIIWGIVSYVIHKIERG